MSGFEGTARDKFGQISDLVDKLHMDNRGLLADLDGEEVPDDDYEASASDDEVESTDDDQDDVRGDIQGYAVTNKDLLNMLGVIRFEELDEADDDYREVENTKMKRKSMSTYQDVCQDTLLLLLQDPRFLLTMSERSLLGRFLMNDTMLASSALTLVTTS